MIQTVYCQTAKLHQRPMWQAMSLTKEKRLDYNWQSFEVIFVSLKPFTEKPLQKTFRVPN